MRPENKKSSKRYKNVGFLQALGKHCQRLRTQRGYSIDRMAKESEQLSASVIHRLETGSGAVTVIALYRYAEILQLPVKQLFEFSFEEERAIPKLHTLDSSLARKEAFKTMLPLYSLKAAAGYFGKGEEVKPEAWIEVNGLKKLHKKMFVARAVGNSMLPKIKNGDYLVFRADPEGSRQGKIVLAQYRGPADPETGGTYTVKKYMSQKASEKDGGWRHKQIELRPLNSEFHPIILHPEVEADFRIIAEYIDTLDL